LTAQPSPSQLVETTQIATALRLGWYFTELRGRHDKAVFRQPRPPVVDSEDALCLGDERSPEEQAAEVAAVVGAAAEKLGADAAIPIPGPTANGAPATTASESLAAITLRLRTGTTDASLDEAWHDLEELLVGWDEEIQRNLAVASPRVSAAYQLGRALADVRWSLHPAETDSEMHGWRFLLGPWRSSMLARLIDRLSPYFGDKLTPVALKRSIARWAKVVRADDLISSPDAPRVLAAQSEVWHDLLLSERSASDLIDHDVDSLVRNPSLLLLAIKPFRLEIILLALSFLGFIAASWLVLTNTPAPPSGSSMGSAPAAQSVVGVAQSIGGQRAVSAVIAVLSLFGITLAGLSARAKARLQDMVEEIRENIDQVLAGQAATLLPTTTWPLPPDGNLYLRFATLRQRSVAVLIDWLVLLACNLIVIFATWLILSVFEVGQFALRNTVVVVTLLMSCLYFTGWPAGSGRGIGMWTQRMRVLDAEGGWVPGTVQTIRRAVAVMVPFELLAIAFWLWPTHGWVAVPLLLAVAWVAVLCWTVAVGPNRRGWHDTWAGTLVVAATDPAYDFATVARPRPRARTVWAVPAAKPAPAASAAAAEAPEPADPTPVGAGRGGLTT
jgi:uncharacterized RDD family membrane protein YckC